MMGTYAQNRYALPNDRFIPQHPHTSTGIPVTPALDGDGKPLVMMDIGRENNPPEEITVGVTKFYRVRINRVGLCAVYSPDRGAATEAA